MRLYLGDTLVLSDTLTQDGEPVDLTGATVDVIVGRSTEMSGQATITDATAGAISYQVTASEAGAYTIRYRVVGEVTTTFAGPSVTVVDPDSVWASIADVEAIVGDQDDSAVIQAITQAMALISSWLCEPVPDPLPPEFTTATAMIAATLVQAPSPTDPVAETIGDYSYRMPGQPDPARLRSTIYNLLSPWLCPTLHSVRVWPDPALAGRGDCLPEFQPDAEGFLRS